MVRDSNITMIFLEKKTKTGYTYNLEEIFGTVEIDSSAKLDKYKLDGIIGLLLKQNSTAKTVQGEVKVDDFVIKYVFVKAPVWSDDDDDEKKPCEDLPTSTRRLASAYIPMLKLITKTLNWPKRFGVAFLEAWKKAK